MIEFARRSMALTSFAIARGYAGRGYESSRKGGEWVVSSDDAEVDTMDEQRRREKERCLVRLEDPPQVAIPRAGAKVVQGVDERHRAVVSGAANITSITARHSRFEARVSSWWTSERFAGYTVVCDALSRRESTTVLATEPAWRCYRCAWPDM